MQGSDARTVTASDALRRLNISVDAIPAEQREYFADDTITFAEYRDAVERDAQCLSDSGYYDVSAVTIGSDGTAGFDATYDAHGGPGVDETLLDTIYSDCAHRFVQVTGMVWSLLNVPSIEEKSALRPALIACLNSAGLSVAQDASAGDVIDALNDAAVAPNQVPPPGVDEKAIASCVDEYSRFFVVPPPN